MKNFDYTASLTRLQTHVDNMKSMLEHAITFQEVEGRKEDRKGRPFLNGLEAKRSLIRSQHLIYELHEFVKEEFLFYGINPVNIYPPLCKSKPEITMTGTFKRKDQDVCVVPNKIPNKSELINWGPLRNSNTRSIYGSEKEEKILATNVRSQLSSINKNIDTLFERMISESLNLHDKYPKLVLGELYLIPIYEYDDTKMKSNKVEFKSTLTNIEKFIRFFSYLNNYQKKTEPYKYTKAGLIVVDFRKSIPKIYKNTAELKKDKLISTSFNLELADLSPIRYVYDLLCLYNQIWGLNILS
ncbi:hypothetical protein [Lactiplantibacillus plantarum]|uniref:hypothetical protein n=2 Tax=Lactiplantibacillus plantarum TaxID=1590 RepID=UPI0009301BF7|nr:hypothetical protein [Lactiplantibacillus plantarum]